MTGTCQIDGCKKQYDWASSHASPICRDCFNKGLRIHHCNPPRKIKWYWRDGKKWYCQCHRGFILNKKFKRMH